ncbi:aldolase/citrate lyase family protein [Arthrobacter agilis]|uniref:HpcH/HpaI aldolase family protein n=1 Tax=Arthrobacter agilis TaxID=37921 RepID=UPI0023668058|nr:aldolase/citrate lyase family protein [Arthrobacter agilis]WDF32603.1 aldolase/citrate lyase family protein [Arthrobacter agilis]
MTDDATIHDPLLGVWATLGEPRLTRELGTSGPGWVGLDAQHGHFDDRALRDALAHRPTGSAPMLVRVAGKDATLIGRALDAGADGVVVPLVDTVADAEAAVAASHYPPLGARSWGPLHGSRPAHTPGTDARTHPIPLCAVMIETAAGLEAVEAIAAVPGVDMIFVGPFDLSLALGVQVEELLASEDDDAPLRRITTACSSAGIRSGAYAGTPERAAVLARAGFHWIASTTDTALLPLGIGALRGLLRQGQRDQVEPSEGNASS